jgi:hypothetical protein
VVAQVRLQRRDLLGLQSVGRRHERDFTDASSESTVKQSSATVFVSSCPTTWPTAGLAGMKIPALALFTPASQELSVETTWQCRRAVRQGRVPGDAGHEDDLGVATTVVHDQAFVKGELVEDTFDWFAQDSAGNVWYVGEDTKELESDSRRACCSPSLHDGLLSLGSRTPYPKRKTANLLGPAQVSSGASVVRLWRRSFQRREDDMKYVLLIQQGDTPTPYSPDEWAKLSEDEKQEIYSAYAAVNETPGVTPGVGLQAPEAATTVRVQDGKTLTTDGPFVAVKEALGGWLVYDADDLDAAIELASRIPAARLGGAVEIRPVVEW